MFCWMFRNLGFLRSKFSYLTIYRLISKRRVFGNLGFLKSKFSYLTIGQYRREGYLQISDFSKSKFSYLTIGENWKMGFIKAGEKKSAISEDIREVFNLACEQIQSHEKSSRKVSSVLVQKRRHKLFQSLIYVYFDVLLL